MQNERCKETVFSGPWSRSSQCSRKAVADGYCKQHHPDAVAERVAKSNAKYELESAKLRSMNALRYCHKSAQAYCEAVDAKDGNTEQLWDAWKATQRYHVDAVAKVRELEAATTKGTKQ